MIIFVSILKIFQQLKIIYMEASRERQGEKKASYNDYLSNNESNKKMNKIKMKKNNIIKKAKR